MTAFRWISGVVGEAKNQITELSEDTMRSFLVVVTVGLTLAVPAGQVEAQEYEGLRLNVTGAVREIPVYVNSDSDVTGRRGAQVGTVRNGSSILRVADMPIDLAAGTQIDVYLETELTEDPVLILIPREEVARRFGGLPREGINRVASFPWKQTPLVEISLPDMPADAPQSQTNPAEPTIAVGASIAHDRERSAVLLGLYATIIPIVVMSDVALITSARIDRMGLDFGSRFTVAGLVGITFQMLPWLALQPQVGLFWDRTTIDFGSGSTTGTGTGSILSGGVEVEATPTVKIDASIERHSNSGLSTRVGRLGVKWVVR